MGKDTELYCGQTMLQWPIEAWLVCYAGAGNSLSDCGLGTITSEVFGLGFPFLAGSLPQRLPAPSLLRAGKALGPDSGSGANRLPAYLCSLQTLTLQESRAVLKNKCTGSNQSIFTHLGQQEKRIAHTRGTI